MGWGKRGLGGIPMEGMFVEMDRGGVLTHRKDYQCVYRQYSNRPFSHCLCACVYRSRGALFLDNRRDFTEMGQTDFKPLILSM